MKKADKKTEEQERQKKLADISHQHIRLVEELEAYGFSWDDFKDMVKEQIPKTKRKRPDRNF